MTSFQILYPSVILTVLICPIFSLGCEISEFYCDNGRCVSLDKYCNGVNDCLDGSDEPKYCTPCNRTYIGEIGSTYSIALHRPSSRESFSSFVCQLTFAASGGKFGDLVQLIFNSVTLGPVTIGPSGTTGSRLGDEKDERCKEGFVTLLEPDRPAVGGHWCGNGWGQAVFFSETSRVTLTLTIVNMPSMSGGTFAFDFRLSYKFLRKQEAIVRYGGSSRPYFRGQLLPGTFCSLIFDGCDKRRCAIQTPNFPGIYPPNATCYYAIKQLNAPSGHRAVIQLTQSKDHFIHIRNGAGIKSINDPLTATTGLGASMNDGDKLPNYLTVGTDCPENSDHATIYDGYTIRDPVLLRFCGTGQLPTIVSSGHELLVEFYTVPTAPLLQRSPPTPIQGFHLDVEIKYLPIGSYSYVENHNCHFTISSFQKKRGFLTSPQHSLPSGTTCTYLLEGSPGEVVWISVLKFYIGKEHGKYGDDASFTGAISSHIPQSKNSGIRSGGVSQSFNYIDDHARLRNSDCNKTFFQIWQGHRDGNKSMMAHFCEDTVIRRTCEFMLNKPKKSIKRACFPQESFISKGSHMSLNLQIEMSTALRPVEFKLYYEFVETASDGDTLKSSHLHLLNQNFFAPINLPKLKTSMTLYPQVTNGEQNFNKIMKERLLFPSNRCSRIFKSQNRAVEAGTFTSPRNVFFFGRAGIHNLTCVYRFQGGENERVKITLNKISLDAGSCVSRKESNLGRYTCAKRRSINGTRWTNGQVQIWEVPWNDTRILKDCICNSEIAPYTVSSTSSTLDVVLQIKNMQAYHDQSHFAFDGRYEFVKKTVCPRKQGMTGLSGQITLKVPEKVSYSTCRNHPWKITPESSSHYVYLMVPGHTLRKYNAKKGRLVSTSEEYCSSRNRILVYSGGFEGRLLQIICPEDSSILLPSFVQIFSETWMERNYPNLAEMPHYFDFVNSASLLSHGSSSLYPHSSRSQLIIELVSLGTGSNGQYNIKWLQISRMDEPLGLRYSSTFKSRGATKSLSSFFMGKDGSGSSSAGSLERMGGGGRDHGGGGITSTSNMLGTSFSLIDELENDVCFKFKCPELKACIAPSLFCDGQDHCPSGFDESDCDFLPIPKTYLIIGAASIILFMAFSACFLCIRCSKRKRQEQREKLLMSSRTPTEELFFGTASSHREIVC